VLHSIAEIEIKTHRKVALELLTRPTARLLWQPNLERAVLMEGEAGKTGAVTALSFRRGENIQRTLETVIRVDPRSSLHLAQITGNDEYHLHYGFYSVHPGYLTIKLTIDFKPGSTLGTMRSFFDKKIKTLAAEQLNILNEYVTQQNFKRRIRRTKRKTNTSALRETS